MNKQTKDYFAKQELKKAVSNALFMFSIKFEITDLNDNKDVIVRINQPSLTAAELNAVLSELNKRKAFYMLFADNKGFDLSF